MTKTGKPKILAPAGDKYSFLAAVAAGADAIYCGLKNFSARMEADNFSIEELSRLNALARSKNVQVYVAFNSLVKQNELGQTARTIAKLAKYVRPHALIIQDPGLVEIARKAGFKGEFHLSTLGNCSFSMGLESAANAGFSRVVLPRELTIDEIKLISEKKPDSVDLEVFIHGALCYAVSGRCYWSSWFGGRSGLRGRCVQPCRRLYKQQTPVQEREIKQLTQQSHSQTEVQPKEQLINGHPQIEPKQKFNEQRFFSCLDFSADVLVKVLKEILGVTTWKIEGRKKSPHYVFYTVKGYRMLRDHGHDPAQKKIALSFLDYALGRPATHYNLLTQNPVNPLKKDKDMETGSGLFAGRVRYGGENLNPDIPNFITREALLADDLLRIGYEDDSFHTIQRVTMPVPKKGRLILQQRKPDKLRAGTGSKFKLDKGLNPISDSKDDSYRSAKGISFRKGAPVFIVDRREKEVWLLINELDKELEKYSSPDVRPQEIDKSDSYSIDSIKHSVRGAAKYSEITLYGYGDESRVKTSGKSAIDGKSISKSGDNSKIAMDGGLWLSQSSIKRCSPKKIKDVWWFLPHVVWPVNEDIFYETIQKAISAGAKNFVLNMPWQISCFSQTRKQVGNQAGSNTISQPPLNLISPTSYLNLWAGPFCNVANTSYIEFLKGCGFSGAFVSPELGGADLLALPGESSLPLGIVLKGNWPLAISRVVSDDIVLDRSFISPRGESGWVAKKNNDYWIFPNWHLDISQKKDVLKQAGYKLFLTIDEPVPKGVEMKSRPGLWNWDIDLL